mgnify:CR=1 FL=1
MTKSKFYLLTLLTAILLSVVLGASSSFASDTYSTNQAEPTISVPLTQWNELQNNNAKALSLIEASNIPLNESQTLLVKQANELTEAKNALNLLFSKVEDNISYTLPNGDPRYITIVEKKKETPNKYPRKPGIPLKKPL